MAAYYNEIDPFAAQWLRELIKADQIAPGFVDERSIEDVKPTELSEYTQCHFFAGIGVWSYALRQAGWPDDKPIWTGSCPCQPFSAAGKGKGTDDERHLWPAFHWLIKQCQPDTILGEQVAQKAGATWFDAVSTDLEGENYACGKIVFPACGVGAPHIRQRQYWLGHSQRKGLEGLNGAKAKINEPGREFTNEDRPSSAPSVCNGFWGNFEIAQGNGYSKPVEPGTFPLVDGAASRVGRLRGYGNAIVAPQATEFIKAIMLYVQQNASYD